jgi:hypothetical protein
MSACQSPDAVAPLVSMSEKRRRLASPALDPVALSAQLESLPNDVIMRIRGYWQHPTARLLAAPQYDRWPNAFHGVPRLWNKAHLDALMFWRGGTEFGAPRDEDWTRDFNERFDEENRERAVYWEEEAYNARMYREYEEEAAAAEAAFVPEWLADQRAEEEYFATIQQMVNDSNL